MAIIEQRQLLDGSQRTLLTGYNHGSEQSTQQVLIYATCYGIGKLSTDRASVGCINTALRRPDPTHPTSEAVTSVWVSITVGDAWEGSEIMKRGSRPVPPRINLSKHFTMIQMSCYCAIPGIQLILKSEFQDG